LCFSETQFISVLLVACGAGGARHISGGQVTGIVFLSLLGAAALSVAGVAAWRWWQQKKAERVYFELSDSNHFTQF
jgi:hypothetical protein